MIKKRRLEVHAPSEWNNPKNTPSMGGWNSVNKPYPSGGKTRDGNPEFSKKAQLLKTEPFGRRAKKKAKIAQLLKRKGK